MKSRRPSADWPLFFATVLLVLFADLLTKHLVSRGVLAGEYLGGLLRVTLVSNPGAAFGIFPGARAALIVIKLLALAFIFVMLVRGQVSQKAVITIPLAMIFGGALGNLLDRVRDHGEVIDFIDLGLGARRWYVFNIADACISVGAVLLVLVLMRRPATRDEAA